MSEIQNILMNRLYNGTVTLVYKDSGQSKVDGQVAKYVDRETGGATGRWTGGPTGGWIVEWTDGVTGKATYRQKKWWTDWTMDNQMNRNTDRWADRWTDGWLKRRTTRGQIGG